MRPFWLGEHINLCKGFSVNAAVRFWHCTTTDWYPPSSDPRVFDMGEGSRADSVSTLWNPCDYTQSGGQGVERELMWKLSLIWIKSWRLWRAHFAIIHRNFKAPIMKLEENLTKKQPQRKTEGFGSGGGGRVGDRQTIQSNTKEKRCLCISTALSGRSCGRVGSTEAREHIRIWRGKMPAVNPALLPRIMGMSDPFFHLPSSLIPLRENGHAFGWFQAQVNQADRDWITEKQAA